ncbi:MAG TPA: ABC transporter permease [Steroidobacteraceae bacterium]|nr:ABC transporter permease [Steroidobacteraceae bacterium]
MKYAPLTWAGLRRKPVRTVLTFLSIVTAFLLYGALSGTMAGFDELLSEFFDENQLYTLSRLSPGEPLPVAYVGRVARIPGVIEVNGSVVFEAYYQRPENNFGGVTMDQSALHKKEKGNLIVDEKELEAMRGMRTGILVGKKVAERFGWKVGDRVPLRLSTVRKDRSNVWMFDVVGTWDVKPNSGNSADQIWVNYDGYDEARAFNNGTIHYISTRVSDPAQAERVAQEIDRMFANSDDETETLSLAAAIRAELSGIIDMQLMINGVLGAVFFTLLFVTGSNMVQSVRERIPEFAILKTYGFTDVIVSGLVLTESLVLCVFGAVVGMLVASEVLFPFIFASFKLDPLPMPLSVVAIGIAMAIVLAIVTGLPPALRAGRLNIVDALAGK